MAEARFKFPKLESTIRLKKETVAQEAEVIFWGLYKESGSATPFNAY
jgi:hypothetical protein